MKELTKAEEQVMQILWELDKTSVKDVVDRMDDPKPAYNTISTIIRILEKKGFVDHEPVGKGYLYFPTIGKKEYTRKFVGNVLTNYFNGSVKELVSFFAKEEKLNINDVQDLLDELKNDKTNN
jgi:BlaI family penicillinase repressor